MNVMLVDTETCDQSKEWSENLVGKQFDDEDMDNTN